MWLACLLPPASLCSQERHEELLQQVPLPTGYLTEMVRIPAGSFPRGAEGEEFDEQPVRMIFLDEYLIDKYEVTTGQWDQYQEDTGVMIPEWTLQSSPRRRVHPIVFVTWYDAAGFCEWAGKRLPSEAEWERAARCDDGRKYPWGDGLDDHRANFFQSEDPFEAGIGTILQTTPVGFFDGSNRDGYQTRSGASPFGVQDMVGNVWEWTSDWMNSVYHVPERPETRDNPTGPPTGTQKTQKGGSFLCHRSYCNRYRVAARSSNTPDSSTGNLGFRCVRDV